MMEKIREDTEFVLAATQDALARGDIKHIRYEVDELLKVFQINLDPSCGDYLKLARVIQVAFVKQLKAVLARHRGEPVETPALIEPNQDGPAVAGTLKDASRRLAKGTRSAAWRVRRVRASDTPIFRTARRSSYCSNQALTRTAIPRGTTGHAAAPFRGAATHAIT
jgi:hypothetical protein